MANEGTYGYKRRRTDEGVKIDVHATAISPNQAIALALDIIGMAKNDVAVIDKHVEVKS